MFLAASFFALKTHFELMTLAPGGASSSLQVPAVFKVASSLVMVFSQSGQSGQHLALVSIRGSKASASVVSAASMCSSHSDSLSAANALLVAHTPPVSLTPSSNLPGSCSPVAMDGSEQCADDTPTPSINLRRVRDGLHIRVGRGVLPGSASSSPSMPVDADVREESESGVRGERGDVGVCDFCMRVWMGGRVVGVGRAACCLHSVPRIIISSPLSCAAMLKYTLHSVVTLCVAEK